MNENLNLIEILKGCPKGIKLYTPMFGEVEFEGVYQDKTYPIEVKTKSMQSNKEVFATFTSSGIWNNEYNGECMLFPSQEQRDWSKFKFKKTKFDPNTLKPFDKVLVRDKNFENWNCGFFSHKDVSSAYPYRCIGTLCICCIPYNDDTKHLLGTKEEAPDFYRYWED